MVNYVNAKLGRSNNTPSIIAVNFNMNDLNEPSFE